MEMVERRAVAWSGSKFSPLNGARRARPALIHQIS
jgi:hypothetical protein